eukprot:scaffold1239_cov130-Cylindrotheca_fusiformis.AAC.3
MSTRAISSLGVLHNPHDDSRKQLLDRCCGMTCGTDCLAVRGRYVLASAPHDNTLFRSIMLQSEYRDSTSEGRVHWSGTAGRRGSLPLMTAGIAGSIPRHCSLVVMFGSLSAPLASHYSNTNCLYVNPTGDRSVLSFERLGYYCKVPIYASISAVQFYGFSETRANGFPKTTIGISYNHLQKPSEPHTKPLSFVAASKMNEDFRVAHRGSLAPFGGSPLEDDENAVHSLKPPVRRESNAPRRASEGYSGGYSKCKLLEPQLRPKDVDEDGWYSSENGKAFPTRTPNDSSFYTVDDEAFTASTPGAHNVPGCSNNANNHGNNSWRANEESPDIVVAAEVARDRETSFEEGYQQGALDRERALQEVEEQRRDGEELSQHDAGIVVAVPDDGSKKRRNVIFAVAFVVVVLATGLLIGLLVPDKNTASSDLLPPLMVSSKLPLSLCQGDCDSDVDCQDGLQCFHRITGGMVVPGCSGGQQDLSATDYCIAIMAVDPALEESSESPLGICQGDCDSNADCKAGLICFQRNGGEEVPGCFGGSDDFSRNDYCINQGQFMERLGERLVGSPDDNFGSSVALSSDGMTMAVGAVDLGSTGYVNIYESVGESSWNLVTTIIGDSVGDQFGHSVEVSSDGRTIAIGYILDLGSSPRCCTQQKYSVRVRVLVASSADKSVWNVIGDDISGDDYESWKFEYSFSLSGNGTILALAQLDQMDVSQRSMTIFRNEGGQWARTEYSGLDPLVDPTVSLSKSTDTVRIATSSNSESVQVFDLARDSWQQIGQHIDIGGAVTLSADGNVLAVTGSDLEVPCDDDDPLCIASVTYTIRIYEITADAYWTELGDPIVLDGGTTDKIPAVSLSNDGQNIAIGENLYDDVGRVRLLQYYNISEEWTIVDDILSGHSAKGRFGAELSLAGSSGDNLKLAVGAPFLFSTSGAPGSVTSYRMRLGKKPSAIVSEPTAAPTTLPVTTFDIMETVVGHNWDLDEGIVGGTVSLSSDGRILAYGAMNMNSVGAVGVYDLTDEASRIAELSGDEIGGGFGHAVSLSGDGRALAVGIPFLSAINETIPNVGRVRVFACKNESAANWLQVGADIQPAEVPGDDADWYQPRPMFGHSVALSDDGTVLAVGAINGYKSEGNVDVFRLDNGEWVQMGNSIIGKSGLSGSFGWAVSLSGDGMRLAVAANTEETKWDESGAGRIYEFVDGVWQLLGQELLGEDRHDLFGSSISLSGDGNIVAIGSINNSNDGGVNSGHVRIFEYDANVTTWRLLGKPIIGRSSGDRCGSSVSLSKDGKTVAIGAYVGGYVRVFAYNAENTYWQEISEALKGDSNGGGGGFGVSVALSSDDSGELTLAVGAPLVTAALELGQTVVVAGKVFVFEEAPNGE